ncbi:MAG: AAA family ATPase [Acidobacteria bacterium]|nr:AAA family ATPase [Acidobacteriota bacterium]
MSLTLCPQQQASYDQLLNSLPKGNVFVLYGRSGAGKTSLLKRLQQEHGGSLLNMKDFMEAMQSRHPYALEETFGKLVMDALLQHHTVIVDDFHLLYNPFCCNHFYQRMSFFEAPAMMLASYAIAANKKLIVTGNGNMAHALAERSYDVSIGKFETADYEFLCRAYLNPDVAARLDYAKIYRFAPKLNAHQLRYACLWFQQDDELNTTAFIDYLRAQQLTSNVDLDEVQAVNLHELKGIDDIIQSLEANLILPLEHDELAQEYDLKPKRGVLLAGPPGTGKTTIGKALAHRLRSKFLLIDGTFIAGTNNFYERIQQVFEVAKQNAPAIIFIDDSDVIFESDDETGLYRYLLTMLDGLEGNSAGRVCVMMTAMDVSKIPPALVRSGRIELWLETRLPDEAARAAILQDLFPKLPPVLAATERTPLVTATEGFTGADLKRLVEDGKSLYAYDKIKGHALQAPAEYFLRAVATVRTNKERYAEAEALARAQRPQRPAYYMPHVHFNPPSDD